MTRPELPKTEYPDIERLRSALTDWEAEDAAMVVCGGCVDGGQLAEAARSLIDTFDRQIAEQDRMREQAEQAVQRAIFQGMLGTPSPTDVKPVCTCPGARYLGDQTAMSAACVIHGVL
jgi:hypothetical protein